MKNKANLAQLMLMKGELQRVAKVIEDLKALPNCYSCMTREVCPHCLTDDSKPSRYNCPLYIRDDTVDIVENI